MNRPIHWRRESAKYELERQIKATFTPEEVQIYENLISLRADALDELIRKTDLYEYLAEPEKIDYLPEDIQDGTEQGISLDDAYKKYFRARDNYYICCERLKTSPVYKAILDAQNKQYPDELKYYYIFYDRIIATFSHVSLNEVDDIDYPAEANHYIEPTTKEPEGHLKALSLELYNLEGHILTEINENPKKYKDIRTIEDLILYHWINDQGEELTKGLLFTALRAAKKRKKAKESEEKTKQAPAVSQVLIKNKGINKVEYPLDKINDNIWRDLLTADKNGQLTMYFDTLKQGSEPQALVIYSIDFSALEDASIVKKLTAYDKRVYIAVNGLYAAGYDIISINQIYSVITNRPTTPGAGDREKINKSLSKMAARLHLDNSKERNGTYAKYPLFKYDGALLPFDRIEAEFNGNHADAIRIYRPASEGADADRALPLVRFAKQRGQYTTISTQLFGSLSLTDANLAIEDYLIEQIGHIKKGSINNKMLYETIYQKTGQTKAMQKKRAKSKIHDILDHFKEVGFIKNYTQASDGITITYDSQKAINYKKKK